MAKYMELMEELFERSQKVLSESATKDDVFAFLADNRELVGNIAAAARSTGLFEKSDQQYAEFKVNLLKPEKRVEENVANAYLWVLDRIVNAPTQLHTKSAVALCMPLVDEAFSIGMTA